MTTNNNHQKEIILIKNKLINNTNIQLIIQISWKGFSKIKKFNMFKKIKMNKNKT